MAEGIRVALDGTPLAGPWGGIQRFCQELIGALRSEFPQDHYEFFSDQLPPYPQGLARRWWTIGLNRALATGGFDVFHGTDFAVPYWRRHPSVMTVHDLSPWRFPSPENARVRRRTEWLLRLRIPTFLHTPSETVRREVMERFDWPSDRVRAIPLAAAKHFEPVAAEPKGRYFLYVGALEPRKNLEVLLAAMRLLAVDAPQLWIAGQPRPGYLLPAQANVQVLGPVAESELAELISGAIACLYPSRYEGFGLPVLESLACGTPMIAADIPVLRETGGEAAIYCNVDDPAEWARAMTNAAALEQRRTVSRNRAAQFSWAQTARAMRELYADALR